MLTTKIFAKGGRMKRIAWVALGLLTLLISTCANANDSIARVGAGGLTLLKSDNIQMLEETLTISTSHINVHYRFRNESQQDIKAVVAFPMPEYGFNPGFSESAWNNAPFTSLSDFLILADGKFISPHTTRAALYDGKDITQELRNIGLTDSQIFETFGDCKGNDDGSSIACGLPDAQKAKIDKLIGREITKPQYWVPPWQVTESAYWEQTFPAGKVIEVLHEYKPLVGTEQSPRIGQDGCPDEGSGKAIERRQKAAKTGRFQGYTKEVEYILGTGRNWKGPIRNFHLIIKKDSADQIVSLCFPGKSKKISATEIEFSQANYSPQNKLIIYFVNVAKPIVDN
jgi:hypothetical protein